MDIFVPQCAKYADRYADKNEDYTNPTDVMPPGITDINKTHQFLTLQECQSWCIANAGVWFLPRKIVQ